MFIQDKHVEMYSRTVLVHRAFGKWLGHENRALMDGIVEFTKVSKSLPPLRKKKTKTQDQELRSHQELNFLAPQVELHSLKTFEKRKHPLFISICYFTIFVNILLFLLNRSAKTKTVY